MSGLSQQKEFSRTSFLKGGGALIVGFSAAGAVASSALASDSYSTGTIEANPYADPGETIDANQYASYGPSDPTSLDSWLVVHPDNSISVKLGRVDLGQGSPTAFAMIAAEELNHDMSLMRLIPEDTDLTPNQGSTSGSSSVQTAGKAVRAASAAAYQALLGLASTNLGVPVASLSVTNGVVSGGGKTVTYGQLINGGLFNVHAASTYNLTATTASPPAAGSGMPPGYPGTVKPVSQYTILGINPGPPRLDIPAKVDATYTYVQNIYVPNMLHGRIVRPRGQGAYGNGTNPQVLSIDASTISNIPGARVVQKGNFVGVVAPQEYDAIQAAAQLKVTWAPMPALPGTPNLWGQMRQQDSAGLAPAAIKLQRGSTNIASVLAGAAHTISETYMYNYNGHMPIGPLCCVADVTANGARIYSNTQNSYSTRTGVATILGFPSFNQVRVSYYEGSSVYGSSAYDDAAQAAAVMSQLAGAPVRLQFMRWDEHGYDNYGPAMMYDIQLGADGNGNLIAANTTEFAPPYYSTTPTMALTGTTAQVFGAAMSADTTNIGTAYNVPNVQVTGKSVPLQNNYFKISFLRAPQAPQTCFAFEQAIDELAHAANMDPFAFRTQNVASLASDMALGLTALTYDRWKDVLAMVGQMANWQPKVAASNLQSGNIVTGRGVAMGSYASSMIAEVVDVTVNKQTGKIVCNTVYCAQDTGFIQYPGGVENQGVGSIVQGASRALFEEVTFNKSNVTSLDWVSYPIMRFQDAPKIVFQMNQRTDIPNAPATNGVPGSGAAAGVVTNGVSVVPTTTAVSGVYSAGSGEPPSSCIGAAIANAFFDATGVRLREAPMTPARVRATLKAAGVA